MKKKQQNVNSYCSTHDFKQNFSTHKTFCTLAVIAKYIPSWLPTVSVSPAASSGDSSRTNNPKTTLSHCQRETKCLDSAYLWVGQWQYTTDPGRQTLPRESVHSSRCSRRAASGSTLQKSSKSQICGATSAPRGAAAAPCGAPAAPQTKQKRHKRLLTSGGTSSECLAEGTEVLADFRDFSTSFLPPKSTQVVEKP